MAPRPSSISTFRAVVVGAGAVAAGAAVALGAIELGMRAVSYGSVSTLAYGRANYNHDLPELGYAGRPYAHGIQSNEGVSEIALNSHGFHDVEHSRAKPPGVFRLMVVGNSYTMAIQVALKDGYVAQLGDALKECPALAGRQIETINLGVDGYTIHQQYLLLRDYGLSLKPDFVLLQTNSFVVPGDLDPTRNLSPRLERGPDGKTRIDYAYKDTPQFKAKSSAFAAWLQRLSDHSRLIQYAIQYRRIAREEAAEADTPKGEPKIDPAVYRSFQQGRDLAFDEMAATLRNRDIPFAVTIVPDADGESNKPIGPEPIRNEWRQLAQKAGAPFFDVEKEARARVRATGADLHGFGANAGFGHLNRTGNAFFGKALAARICPMLGGEHSASLAPTAAAQ
ncbi:hypothetical protein K9U39_18970 [Rhodoblastus acidophilus]|uniref:SGNH/GDSL hydrolase family protein n=1 Tax=Candidatus Rhodoblastus alkanivorans TaxID=2954117 RepID=A0ABS9Z2N5_9HYPH|nr:hypothetical protein [Candidatus Rhodoblastus alkanivorans]MCI4680447.1 hypothetical protein [Candidatus Rhodoblastus alkanivorans]MCI4681940.1 hypothetical protein [Candidatus Rhodoblastus alkanivorans]MDI4642990.1 hypothetical protein [Rhodoblastus acidophilus]